MRAMWKVVALLATLTIAGCSAADDDVAGSRMQVVAAFYPLAWGAEEVGGADVDVTNLTPPGAEPHDVELTPRDAEAVHDADLVLYLGGGFQPALERALEGRDGVSLDLLEDQTLTTELDEEGDWAPDPHVWLDPARFAEMVTAIGRKLERQDAATGLAARLLALDEEMDDGLAACERHEIVTSHEAFGYLAVRYGLEQIGLTGLTPEAEPSPGDLVRLVDKVKASGATTVFFETLASPRLAETVARESGAKTAVLNPLEGLTEGEVESGEDYFSVMRANLSALREALECR